MNKKLVIIMLVAGLIVGAGSFYGGMVYQRSTVRQFGPGNFTANGPWRGMIGGQGGQGGQGMMGPGGQAAQDGTSMLNGEVTKKSSNSVTLELQDGTLKTVGVTSDTNINKMADGSMRDVKVGERLIIRGTGDSSGRITADSIQIGTFRRP